jgi:hypothetical protein
MTGDEAWASFENVEIKEQSKQWMHTYSPKKPKKFKQASSIKLMASIFGTGKECWWWNLCNRGPQ